MRRLTDSSSISQDLSTAGIGKLNVIPAGVVAALLGTTRPVTVAGSVTIALSDRRVHVANNTATNIIFPSAATWIAANGDVVFRLKNRNSNWALHPLTPILIGTDTLEDSAAPLPIDDREERTFRADTSVTPNNWERVYL
jgi:hypothetical protein